MGSLLSRASGGNSVQGNATSVTADPNTPSTFTRVEQRVEVEPNDSPRFEHNDPALVQFMEQNGYVVVKSVASPQETDIALDLLWDFLESDDIKMKRNNPNTWTNVNFQRIGSKNNGILSYNGIQQSKFLWFLRLLPKVKDVFASIFETNNLITSFDGANIFRPWHAKNADGFSKTECGWWHVDQGISLRGRHAIQGLVTLHDVSAETGGFCVIPGTHLRHDELMDTVSQRSRSQKNFVYIPPSFPALQEKQILPVCKAGDLILWDSRTIHCNTPSLVHPTTQPTDQLLRAVGYVCMGPTSMASTEVLTKRQLLFEYGEGSNHWPHIVPYEVDTHESRPKVTHIEDVSTLQRELIVGRKV